MEGSVFSVQGFLDWGRKFTGNSELKLESVRWWACYCIASQAQEEFQTKDWAEVWFNPKAYAPILTEKDLQGWLDEQSETWESEKEFLSYIQSIVFIEEES